jgi:hypothetical protein
MAAQACVGVGREKAAATIYELLTPYAERFVVDGIACAVLGSVSRFLGGLAAVIGRHDEADSHFSHALAEHRRTGAPLLVAHTLRQWGTAVLARGGQRGAKAEEMLRSALAIYTELSLEHWASLTERVLATPPPASRPTVFRREGEYWHLVFAGSSVRVRDVKGLGDIARLLALPGREFHVLDLVVGTAPGARPDKWDGPWTPEGDTGTLIDAEARARYRRRLTELEEEVADAEAAADPARAGRAREEYDALVAALTAAYGLGGRARRMGDPAERARSAVTQRIRAALERIDTHHPALGRHLRNSIRTGTFCSYRPEGPVAWEL